MKAPQHISTRCLRPKFKAGLRPVIGAEADQVLHRQRIGTLSTSGGRVARAKFKGTRLVGGFLALPYRVLQSPAFIALPPSAVKLLLDLGVQYRGDNNGDLSLTWRLMHARGWASPTTLHKAKRQLLEAGFVFETRKGHRPNKCSLYAMTWQPLDPSPKHDPGTHVAYVKYASEQVSPCAPVSPGKSYTPTTVAARSLP